MGQVVSKVREWIDGLSRKSAYASSNEEAQARQKATRGRLDELRRDLDSHLQRLAAAEVAPPGEARRSEIDTRSQVLDAIRWETEESATLLRESAADTCQVRALVESVADLNKTRTAFIDAINDRVETSVENMEKVTRSVAAVEKLLNLIEKLGLQTDLLALNATIEAARAGVHGAGFGVVALEMRQLADRTASITKQIYANMHEMRVSTRNTASTLLEARRMGGESRQLGDTGRKNLSDCIDYTLHTEELFRDFQARAKQNGAASVSLDEKWNIAAKVEAPRDAPAQANRETIALCLRVLEEMQHLETRPVSPSVGSLKANGIEMLNTA